MIKSTCEGGLTIVELCRPDKANSLTAGMLEELAELAEAGSEDADLRAFIITGAGSRVFSAGADLDEARAGLATSGLWERLSGAIAGMQCLTIVALNGTLAGGAFGMALACDIRLAVPGATFFYPVAKLGYLPQPSDPVRMAKLIGPARTKLVLLAGQKLSSEQALSFGLIDRIVAPENLMTDAKQLAANALSGNPEVLRKIKEMCQ